MDPAYKPLQHQADKLFEQLEAHIDDHEASAAIAIRNLSRDVREDIESNRTPRSVEQRIQQLQQRLEQLKAAPNIAMSPPDAGQLFNDYEQLRRKIRALPKY